MDYLSTSKNRDIWFLNQHFFSSLRLLAILSFQKISNAAVVEWNSLLKNVSFVARFRSDLGAIEN